MSRSTRKPWVTDGYNSTSTRKTKVAFNRRYRRVIRQDVKQWRNKHYLSSWYSSIPCCCCECLDDWEIIDITKLRKCLGYDLEPSYPPYKKFNDSYDICDYRYFCDEPEYRRK